MNAQVSQRQNGYGLPALLSPAAKRVIDVAPTITLDDVPLPPLPNYTLSSVCPACAAEMSKRACKVVCGRCGFVWDCSEL